LARRHGWTQEQLDHLEEFEARSDFSEKEKVVLRLAERMTRESHGVDEALWADLRRHYDEGEVVELAAVIGLFNYFNRFNNALEMEPTK
jgi:alkylhydroperoxidase family enzyme